MYHDIHMYKLCLGIYVCVCILFKICLHASQYSEVCLNQPLFNLLVCLILPNTFLLCFLSISIIIYFVPHRSSPYSWSSSSLYLLSCCYSSHPSHRCSSRFPVPWWQSPNYQRFLLRKDRDRNKLC